MKLFFNIFLVFHYRFTLYDIKKYSNFLLILRYLVTTVNQINSQNHSYFPISAFSSTNNYKTTASRIF
jgi:hypothetical protein